MTNSGLISVRRLERALRTVARFVAAPGGEPYVPFFERIEAELASRRRTEDARARARAVIAAQRVRENVTTLD